MRLEDSDFQISTISRRNLATNHEMTVSEGLGIERVSRQGDVHVSAEQMHQDLGIGRQRAAHRMAFPAVLREGTVGSQLANALLQHLRFRAPDDVQVAAQRFLLPALLRVAERRVE